MAEEAENQVNLNDVIKEQSQTIQTLVDNIKKTETKSQDVQSPIYYTTPQATAEEKSPNYVLYIAIGLVAYTLLKRGKL